MHERMLEKGLRPSQADMAAYCGGAGAAFEALHAYLEQTYHTSREIRFPYGNGYGWCVTHRRGRKLVCDVFAEAGAYTVMLRLPNAVLDALYPRLGAEARQALDRRYPCGDGGWVRLRVTGEGQEADQQALLDAKCG